MTRPRIKESGELILLRLVGAMPWLEWRFRRIGDDKACLVDDPMELRFLRSWHSTWLIMVTGSTVRCRNG